MKKFYAFSGIVLLLAGGGFGWWKFRPATKVEIKVTDKELKKGDAFPHEMWTKVLRKYCKEGFIDYRKLKDDQADLDAYLGFVVKYSPESAPDLFPKREDRFAYAINAYNASVLKGVLNNYPIESVLKIGAVPYDIFKKTEFTFGGKIYTLEAWETRAREEFKDPRIHFALNCASRGCPRLPGEAFEPAHLDEQLSREAKKFVTEDRNVQVADGKAKISLIFKWYQSDFIGKDARPELLKKIKEFGNDGVAGDIEFLDYDWGLNEQK